MKSFSVIIITVIGTLGVITAIWLFVMRPPSPLINLLRTISISRIESENRTLEEVLQDLLKQVEHKTGKSMKIIFSPKSLSKCPQCVFGNPPIEGKADDALYIVLCDYHCHVSYLNHNTLLFYYDKSD
jgi:hypothetical protein